jgi:hypothetical protein
MPENPKKIDENGDFEVFLYKKCIFFPIFVGSYEKNFYFCSKFELKFSFIN